MSRLAGPRPCQASHPQYFDCPFVATDVRQYTFKEARPAAHLLPVPARSRHFAIPPSQVRQKFGSDFQHKFWPIFQAFNCLLPVLAPDAERDDSLASFFAPF